MIRYPIEPLLEAMGVSWSQAAQQLGIGGPEYRRYRDEGMTRDTAERKALKAGFHPYEVWPDMADHDAEAVTVECAADDCPVRFIPPPTGPGQKRRLYHDRNCQTRWNAKVRYQTVPEVRERRKEAARRYKAEARAIVERRQKRAS